MRSGQLDARPLIDRGSTPPSGHLRPKSGPYALSIILFVKSYGRCTAENFPLCFAHGNDPITASCEHLHPPGATIYHPRQDHVKRWKKIAVEVHVPLSKAPRCFVRVDLRDL